jgi:hypothetical protein
MTRPLCWLLLLATLACEGGGSDIGPSIAEIGDVDYRVLVQDDLGRPVVNAAVSIPGFAVAATGRLGRARITGRPSGNALITVDGTAASASDADRLGTIRVAALAPDGDELPYVVHLPDLASSAAVTVSAGMLAAPVAVDGVLGLTAGTAVVHGAATSIELRTATLAEGHLPGALPVPASGARLWSRGLFIDPPDATFAPGGALSLPNDLGLPPSSACELWGLDASGNWVLLGAGVADPSGTSINAAVGSIPGGGLYAFALPIATTTTLSARVVDGVIRPVAGAIVRVSSASTRTLADGSFTLPPIAAVDASGAPRDVALEVNGGRDLLPLRALGAFTLVPGQQSLTDVVLETAPVSIVRLQFVERGRAVANRRLRISTTQAPTVGVGVTDARGEATYEDQVTGFVGTLTSQIRNQASLFVTEVLSELPTGSHHVDLQIFAHEQGWLAARSRGGPTGTLVVDAVGTGPIRFASVVRGTIPGDGFVGQTEENGIVSTDYGNHSQATACIQTRATGLTVTSAFTLGEIDTSRIEIPLERARLMPAGAFDAHGLVSGQLVGGTAGAALRRVAATRAMDLEDWYDAVFEGEEISAVPRKVDPALTAGTDFTIGVPLPRGHLVAAEGMAAGGMFRLDRLGLLVGIEPTPGGEVRRDVTLDLVADTDFPVTGALVDLHPAIPVADLSFDLGIRLADGMIIDAVRDIDGNTSVSGTDVTFRLPALQGALAGARHLVAFGGSVTTGGKAIAQHTFIPLDGPSGASVSFLGVPDIVTPLPGETVSSSGFTVQFTVPPDTLYTVVELRGQTAGEERVWTAVQPGTIDNFVFRMLPPQVPQPLAPGLTWTLKVTAARVQTGPLTMHGQPYRSISQNWVGIGASEREVNGFSSTAIQITTN